ncbi:MAG TPA: hypothetical protein VHE30_05750 [Polyangiaceae bacterium]|nr:hypothetical protein [Polyangiaceae bacterium]
MIPLLARSALRTLTALALLQASPALAADPNAPVEAPDENTRARLLYRQSSEAFKAGKFEEARTALLEAWNIRKTYDVASSLAQVELELELPADAAEHLDFAIRNFAPVESDQTLQQTKTAFEHVRSRVATVTVSVDHDGAEVLVDRRSVGQSPLARPVYLAPGVHTLQAKLSGSVVSKTLLAEAGTDPAVTLALGIAGSAPAPIEDRPAPPEPAPGKSIAPVLIGGAVVVVGLGLGLGFRAAGNDRHDHALALQSKIPPGGCEPGAGSGSDCAALKDAASSADRDLNVSTVGFVVAGAAAVGTVAYWLFWPEPHARSSVHVGASVTARSAGAWLGTRF